MQRLGLSAKCYGYRYLTHSLAGSSRRLSSFSGPDHDSDVFYAAKTEARTTPAYQQATAPAIAATAPSTNGGDQWSTPGGYGPGRMPMGQAYGPPSGGSSNSSSSDGNNSGPHTHDAGNTANPYEYVQPQPIFDMQSSTHLSPIKRVDVRSFKGRVLVDIRQFFRGPDGTTMPSKKGIALTIPQWRRLQEAMGDIDSKLRGMEEATTEEMNAHERGEQGPGGRAL